MLLSFILTMPQNNAWNGKWTGDGQLYARIRKISGKENIEKVKDIIGKSFYYNFGDGWAARIAVSQVNASEANKLRKKTKGFCGYEWMIDSIVANKEIVCENVKLD